MQTTLYFLFLFMVLSLLPSSLDTSGEKIIKLPDFSAHIAGLLAFRDEASLSLEQTAEIAGAMVDQAIRQYPDVPASLVVAHLKTQLAKNQISLENALAA